MGRMAGCAGAVTVHPASGGRAPCARAREGLPYPPQLLHRPVSPCMVRPDTCQDAAMPLTAADLARLPQDQRRAALEGMSAADLASLEWHWPFWARPDQLPPEGDWRTFLLLGGRGSG